MKIRNLNFIGLMLILFAFPLQTLAEYCACCAERGEYSIKVRQPDDYEMSELKRLQIAETNLFTDTGYPENILGLKPLSENYTSNFRWLNAGLKFDFQNEKKETGSLNLTKSPNMVDYRTDTYNEGEPILYKELRFKSKVLSGTGFFQLGIIPATEYFLVFQGKGNQCMAAEQFTHWRLEITGKKASYSFFGTLKTSD